MARSKAKKPAAVGVASVQRSKTPMIVGISVGIILLLLVVAIIISAAQGEDESLKDAAPYQSATVDGAALAVQADDASTPDGAVGSQAPAVHGKTFTGDPVDITADGRPKAVMFFAHWCPHCQAELPKITKWMKQSASKYHVDFYAVATGTSPAKANYPPAAWFKKVGYPGKVIADDSANSIGNAYGLASYPYLVFLDGKDRLVARTSGETPMTDFENFVQRATAAGDGTGTTTTTTAAGPSTTAGPSSPAQR